MHSLHPLYIWHSWCNSRTAKHFLGNVKLNIAQQETSGVHGYRWPSLPSSSVTMHKSKVYVKLCRRANLTMLSSARFEQQTTFVQFSVHTCGRQTVSLHCLKWCWAYVGDSLFALCIYCLTHTECKWMTLAAACLSVGSVKTCSVCCLNTLLKRKQEV